MGRRRARAMTTDERRRARPGRGAGRGRARRSRGAPRPDGADLPRADGPRAAAPAVPAGGAVVHALAGAPRRAQSARRVAARQRVVARGQRAAAARRLRGGRAPRRAGRASRRRRPCGSGWSSARGRRGATGTGRTTRASSAATWSTGRSPSRERAGALLHERRAGCACCTRTPRRRRRAWRWGGSPARPPARRPAARHGGRVPLARRVLPDRYPLDRDVERYIADEQRLGRMLDYAVIVPRLQRLYEWSAEELAEPRLLELVRDGNPIYAWPFEERHVWRSGQMPFAGRVLAASSARRRDTRAGGLSGFDCATVRRTPRRRPRCP